MTTFVVIAVIALLIFCFAGGKPKDNQKNLRSSRSNRREPDKYARKPAIRMLNRDGNPREDEWYTKIAGVTFHNNRDEVGGFSGWVANDPSNKVDKNAMGIYNESGRLLGYIPADELDSYRRWCDGQPQPCVGIIYTDEDYLCGRVKILRPCNPKFLQDEFSKYLQWIHDNYGRSYLPKKLSMQFETE